MPINFRKITLSSIAGAALTLAGAAQANNSLLFPFVTTSDSAYTFVSVFENPYPPDGLSSAVPDRNIAYRVSYGVKPVNAAPGDQCRHRGFDVTMKQGGILQWEVGRRFDLPGDFGDVYVSDMNQSGNRVPANYQGFMIVQYDHPVSTSATLHGEALIVDTAVGLIMTYPATNQASLPTDFSRNAGSEFVTSWMPRVLAGTTWYVLPLGAPEAMTPSNGGGLSSKVVVRTNVRDMGAYERNGTYYPGVKVQTLTCFGIFDVDALLHYDYPMGGWLTLKTLKTHAADTSMLTGDFQPSQVWKLLQSGELGLPVASMSAIEAIR